MKIFFTLFIFSSLLFNFSFAQTLTDSLCARYSFNGNANDNSGNGNNGTVTGATPTTDRFGNANSAYSFNGTTNFITYTPNQHFKPDTFPFAVTAWIKSNNTSVGTIFKNDAIANQYSGIIFQVNPNGVLQVYYGDGGTTGMQYRRSKLGTIDVNDNQWHFVAGVVRGTFDMDLYIDCHYDSLAYYEGGGGNIFYSTNNGCTGFVDVVSGNSYFKGDIDELRLYNRNLTQTDLMHLYSFPQPFDGLSVSLGNNSTPCIGTSFPINPTTTGNILNYNWSTDASTTSISVTQTGIYILEINNACSFAADTIHVTFIDCSEGINDIVNGNSIEMNFISESNSVMITAENFFWEKLSVEMFNATGQKIKTEKNISFNKNYEFKLPDDLAKGIYLVRVSINGIQKTIRGIKN